MSMNNTGCIPGLHRRPSNVTRRKVLRLNNAVALFRQNRSIRGPLTAPLRGTCERISPTSPASHPNITAGRCQPPGTSSTAWRLLMGPESSRPLRHLHQIGRNIRARTYADSWSNLKTLHSQDQRIAQQKRLFPKLRLTSLRPTKGQHQEHWEAEHKPYSRIYLDLTLLPEMALNTTHRRDLTACCRRNLRPSSLQETHRILGGTGQRHAGPRGRGTKTLWRPTGGQRLSQAGAQRLAVTLQGPRPKPSRRLGSPA
jgi:hypothetical protein